jgi:hypothetical protein
MKHGESEMSSEGQGGFRLNTEGLTWIVLLGHWTAFARTAVKLPKDAASQRLKACVPDLIGLQAVWFALGSLETLTRSEQLLGLNRAGVLIDRHAENIRERWEGQPVPTGVQELIQDAHAALDRESRRLVGENPAGASVDGAFSQ